MSVGSPAPSGPQNDPAVSDAANRLDALLRQEFGASYAGLVLKHPERTIVIYRKPDTALDERALAEASDVTVELRDARMSLGEMQALVTRVMADTGYWRHQGVTITGAGPKPDGSGIEVMTSTGADDRTKLTDRYGTDAITVTAGAPVFPTGQRWTPSTSPS
jgi:hypothetical protein